MVYDNLASASRVEAGAALTQTEMRVKTPQQKLADSNRKNAARRKLVAETTGLADCGQSSASRYNYGCRCAKCRAKAAKARKAKQTGA